jgi:hypothetical protein
MSRPSRFKAETKYGKSQARKANRNLPTMAAVGNGGGVVATGRDNFYWIRLVNDDNRLTQCYSLIPLANNDLIYVRRARDRDLSYYEFDKFIQGAGGTEPPVQVHNLLGPAHDDTTTDAPTQGSLIAADVTPEWDELPIGTAHQILKVNAGATDPVWAAFVWDDISAAAGADMVHDHSSAAEGGDDLNPETISTRTLIVGTGCPYTTLGAAVAAVPGTPCTIKVMGITTTETGDVTVPSDVTVFGMGEGSIIDMGANTLFMRSNTSLQHLTVMGSDAIAGVVEFRNTYDQQVIRDCYIENTSTGRAVHVDEIDGTAYIYDSVLVGGQDGIYVGGSATYPVTLYMNNVRVSGDPDAMHVQTANTTVYTEYCTFTGATNDVNLVAGTWYHIKCEWDANNSVIGGTETPLRDGSTEIAANEVTTKVHNGKVNGAHSDFASAQAAINWAVANGYRHVYFPTGTYGSILVSNGEMTIEGSGMGSIFTDATSHCVEVTNRRVTLKNFAVLGSPGGGNNRDCIHVSAGGASYDCFIRGILFRESDRYGLYSDGDQTVCTGCIWRTTAAFDSNKVYFDVNSRRGVFVANAYLEADIVDNGAGNVVANNS